MPGKPDMPHRIRVRTNDGKTPTEKELNQLKSNKLQMSHLFIRSTDKLGELIICAREEKHIAQVRQKLAGVGLTEIEDGNTEILPVTPRTAPPSQSRQRSTQQRDLQSTRRGGGSPRQLQTQVSSKLQKKPYGFVSIPNEMGTSPPIWHNGEKSKQLLSGEIRFELETLSPLLVGWERSQVGNNECDWPIQRNIMGFELENEKSVICPLRAPWGKRPVIIPGDSLKGLLRHEIGALLGAPMERVAERSYSYRPNAKFASNTRLIARIARVPADGLTMMDLDEKTKIRVPTKLELLPTQLCYDKQRRRITDYYRFDDGNGAAYRGGQGAGQELNARGRLHTKLTANPSTPTETVSLSERVKNRYLATVRHLVDLDHGHFSERHPDVPERVKGDVARSRILAAAKEQVFQPGDFVWVEWDTQERCVVSFGWHYYYRWSYTDTVRIDSDAPRLERLGLFPLEKEREKDSDGAPKELSAVRRLFGYTGDNDGSAEIGKVDYSQLMGRVFVNAALEIVGEHDTDDQRFLLSTFLKELGMPRPSAVEHYLKQPYHPQSRPWDGATLMTYGDADGYDKPGELAGRKFYLDRDNAQAEDNSDTNKTNKRSTLAFDASRPERKFRFTVRFRDLEKTELAAVLVAMSPDQFKDVLGGKHVDGYCSKLGYARPLGWGRIRIVAKQILLLTEEDGKPTLQCGPDMNTWVKENHRKTQMQEDWLNIHRCNHPDAGDYPRPQQEDGERNGNIYSYHSALRADHSRLRRSSKSR
jgi:CRISPR-associated protein (TIGR03986 family)